MWKQSAPDEDDDDPVLAAALEDDTNLEDEQMAKLLGFSSFDTTKVTKSFHIVISNVKIDYSIIRL